MTILSSASKIVFILLAISLCKLTWVGIVDPKDFVGIVGMVFVYYFGKNQNVPSEPTQNKE